MMQWLRNLLSPVKLPSRESEAAQKKLYDSATHCIVLRLDPALMEDPDLEVRWEIDKLLLLEKPWLPYFDDGYGFARHSEAMLLVYATYQPDRLIATLTRIVELETVCGNRLAGAAMIGLAKRVPVEAVGDELKDFVLVYPPSEAGKPVPD
jgi:hypothetical protein